MSPVERYLQLSTDYCDELGGLGWSPQADALEYPDGSTFAVAEEVALFVEGFASGGRLIHFNYVLHLLDLVRRPQKPLAPSSVRLSKAFDATGRRLRNAGALCATLCQEVPPASGAVDVMEVLAALRGPFPLMRETIISLHSITYPSELPPLGAVAFEKAMLAKLQAYSTKELHEWLLHGRGPLKEAGRSLARAVPLPRTLSGALAALLQRPRLAGARPFVAQMLSAVALPPRRRIRPEVALGGYAEVATHGQPDNLLLSQFALDEWDFLRRYADRELLYFRREDPQVQSQHQLVVLLDQGVRTWGDVRLVLAAAALALGRQAERGKIAFLMAATSSAGAALDPVEVDNETLGAMVEASDLSANPGLALEALLEKPSTGSRDIVLLTHPRNLGEEDVRAAALRANGETRVLALTLDGQGQAALSELRHGVPVTLRQFRVDFNPQATVAFPTDRQTMWRGDVEPIGFPFRFGTGTKLGPDLFDFDYEGRWLLTATLDGMLYAWKIDGSGQMEILPRPMVKSRLIRNLQAVVGVSNGFVVAGQDHENAAVAHYDFGKRTCSVYVLGKISAGQAWVYAPHQNSVVARTPARGLEYALDLGTGACYPTEAGPRAARAWAAWQAAVQGKLQPSTVPCVQSWASAKERNLLPFCCIGTNQGQIRLIGIQPLWNIFLPLADGRPVLEGCELLEAKYAGNFLAVKVYHPSSKTKTLRLFRGLDGTALAEHPVPYRELGFALSSDGKHLARQLADWRVEVRDTEGIGRPHMTTYLGRFSPDLYCLLGDHWMLLRAGKGTLHLLRWDGGRLEVSHTPPIRNLPQNALFARHEAVKQLLTAQFGTAPDMTRFTLGHKPGVPLVLQYDLKRFGLGAMRNVSVVLDRFGQVAVLDAAQKLVAMFFVFQNALSGWLPSGTCFGPASATGQPPTAKDLEEFGRALGGLRPM